MRRPLALCGLLWLVPALVSPLGAQSQGQAFASVRLLPALAVTGTQDLAFGTVASTQVKTVTATNGGRFSIRGQNSTPVLIQFTQLPASLGANLALSNWTGRRNTAPGTGGATAFVPVPGGSITATLSTNGRYFLWLGATLTATNAAAGNYSVPVVVTVVYN